MSVRFVESAVQLFPDHDPADPGSSTPDDNRPADLGRFDATIYFGDDSRILRCGLCTQSAVFTTPDGLRCDEHAWQEAALLDWERTEPWVPIRLGANAS